MAMGSAEKVNTGCVHHASILFRIRATEIIRRSPLKSKIIMNFKKYVSLVLGFVALVVCFSATSVSADTTTSTAASSSSHARPSSDMRNKSNMMRGKGSSPAFGRGIFGTVTSVSGTTLTVSGKQGLGSTTATTTFTVNASNAKVMKDNATSTIASVVTGDTVFVQGTVSGTNVTATMIRDGVWKPGTPGKNGTEQKPPITGNGQPVVAGTVSSINGSTIVITNKSGVQYTVDASSGKVVKGKDQSSLANIAVGDSVVVQGSVTGNSVVASSIMDEAQTAKKGGFFGGIGQFFQHLFGF